MLGIGGSALGPIALRTALRPPQWNLLDDAARGGHAAAPRARQRRSGEHLARCSRGSTCDAALFVVISKSGGTAETMAQYLVVRARLNAGARRGRRRSISCFVTDPQKGALRAIARAEGIAALDIPANVGGRFSVLTPVGMLPAALIGIDTGAAARRRGATCATRCASSDLGEEHRGRVRARCSISPTRSTAGTSRC